MLIACLGDTHIPERADRLPDWVWGKLMELRPDRILFTGDATEEVVLLLLERLAPVYAVRGNMDPVDMGLPGELSLDFDGLRFMLIHGHQFGRGAYGALARHAEGHDFLVCGHTHACKTFKEGGVVVINPGSATGAWGGGTVGDASADEGGRGGGEVTGASFATVDTETRQVVIFKGDKHGIKNQRLQE